MAALLREGVHGRKDRKRESVEQEDMRKLADDLLDLAGKSPTSSLEIAHPCPEVVVTPALRAQHVALQMISQEVLFGREVVDLARVRLQSDLGIASACIKQA